MVDFTYGHFNCQESAPCTVRQGRSGHCGENSVALPGIETRSFGTVLRQFTVLAALISVKIP